MLILSTASKRVNRILIQGKRHVPTQNHYLQTILQIRTMSTVNKSESEWRAVLSPEQVCIMSFLFYDVVADMHILGSLEFFVRRELNARVLGNMTNTPSPGSTPAQGVKPHFTRALPSLMYVHPSANSC